MEDEESDKNSIAHGHITSISVLREYRKLGIATKLMRAAQFAMETVYQAKYCSLHVRVSNEAAIALYGGVLNYEKNSVAEKYYADGEDAFDMVLYFDKSCRQHVKSKTKNKLKFDDETENNSTAAATSTST